MVDVPALQPPTPFNPLQALQGYATLGNTVVNTQNAQLQNQDMQQKLNNQASADVLKSSASLLALPADQRVGEVGYNNLKREADYILARNPTEANKRAHDMFLQQLEPPMQANGQPTDYTARIAQHLLGSAAISGPDVILSTLGQPTQQNTGGHILQGTQSGVLMNGGAAMGGGSQFTPGSVSTMTPSVGDNMQTRNTVDTRKFLPDGKPNPNYNQPTSVPAVPTMPNISQTPTVTPVAPGRGGTYRGPLPVAPGNLPAPGAGGSNAPPRLPGAETAPAATTAPSSPAEAPGALATGPAPGSMAPIEDSTAKFIIARDEDNKYAQNMEALNHMKALSKDQTTGAAAHQINEVRSFLQNVAGRMGFTAAQIDTAKADELGKMFAQYLNARGAGSDARLAALGAGSMSMDKSALANEDLISRAQMLSRMDHAAFQSFKNNGGTPGTFSDYYNDFAGKHHPLAFYEPNSQEQLKGIVTQLEKNGQLKQYIESRKLRHQIENGPNTATTPIPGQ